MALRRCPACQLPMTDAEAAMGRCPSCDAPVEVAPVSTEPKGPSLPKEVAAPGIVRGVLWGAMGLGLFAFVCWMIVGNMPHGPEPKKNLVAAADSKKTSPSVPEKEPEPKEPAREEKKSRLPEPEKIVDRDPKTPEPPEPKDPLQNPAKEVAKKEEPKKADDPPAKKDDPAAIAKKEDPGAQVKPANVACLPFVKDATIKIDGDVSDWKGIAPVALFAVQRGRSPLRPVLQPQTQTAYLAYSTKGLLVAVEAIDTSGFLENAGKPPRGAWSYSDNDAVEIFLDTLNSRDPRRGGDHAHHFFAFPFGALGEPNIAGYESRIAAKGGREEATILPVANPQPILRAAKKTIVGWTIEMLIPKTALRPPELKPGDRIALDLQLDTGTNVVYRLSCKDPTIDVALAPNAWGETILGGTDGVLELLSLNKARADRAPLGQPLLIRVTDPDRDQNPSVKEKIEVTLKTRSGVVRKLVLEETTIHSGVFVGGIIPRLKAPASEKALIAVEESDSISVEYVDAFRANGDRNVVVRESILTGIGPR